MISATDVLVALSQLVVLFFANAYAVIVPTAVALGWVVVVPPVLAVYHTTASPVPGVALAVCAEPS